MIGFVEVMNQHMDPDPHASNADRIPQILMILLCGMVRSRCPLLYEWHGKRYYGAAHGLAGIYSLLLQARDCLTQQELRYTDYLDSSSRK